MTAMEAIVPFDPTSDPPFGDRTQAYKPRPHGVIKIKNVSPNTFNSLSSSVSRLELLIMFGAVDVTDLKRIYLQKKF